MGKNLKKVEGTIFAGLPVTGHPLWGEVHGRKAKAFNRLSGKLEKAKISLDDLHEVIYAVQDYERLSFQYVTGKSTSDFRDLPSYPVPVLLMERTSSKEVESGYGVEWFIKQEKENISKFKQELLKLECESNVEKIMEIWGKYKVSFLENVMDIINMSKAEEKYPHVLHGDESITKLESVNEGQIACTNL